MSTYLGQSLSRLFSLSLLAPLAVGCDGAAPPAITVETGNPPALVAFREEGAASWQAVTAAADGSFRFEAAGPYRVVIACETATAGASSVEIMQYARTPEDGPTIAHRCARADRPFHLRGKVVQPGVITFGELSRAGTTASWDLDVPAAAGSYDLVARIADRIAIRRDVAVTADTQLGTLDFPSESTAALVPTTFTVSNMPQGEQISASTLLDTGSTTAVLQDAMSGGGGWIAKLAPESVLEAADRQTVVLSAAKLGGTPGAKNRYRSLQRDVRVGGPTTATLPEPLGEVTFVVADGKLTATWAALPEHDEVALRWSGTTMQATKDHVVALSRSFLEATGATSAVLELRDIPGFKDSWRQDAAAQQTHELTASRSKEGEQARSQVTEVIPPGQ